MSHAIENGSEINLDFKKLASISQQGLKVIPVVIQDAQSKDVLIVGYTNQEALSYTLTHHEVALWSTSRNELWRKGATSGDKLRLVEIRVNCEQNSLLYLVECLGRGVCHTQDASGKARRTCYYRQLGPEQLIFFQNDDIS